MTQYNIDAYIGLCGRGPSIEARQTLDEVQSQNMAATIDQTQRLRVDVQLNGVDGKEVGVIVTGRRAGGWG